MDTRFGNKKLSLLGKERKVPESLISEQNTINPGNFVYFVTRIGIFYFNLYISRAFGAYFGPEMVISGYLRPDLATEN